MSDDDRRAAATTDHANCPGIIRAAWERASEHDRLPAMEITISTAAPIISAPWTQPPLTCPHGIDFWIEPTSEAIAQWRRDEPRADGTTDFYGKWRPVP